MVAGRAGKPDRMGAGALQECVAFGLAGGGGVGGVGGVGAGAGAGRAGAVTGAGAGLTGEVRWAARSLAISSFVLASLLVREVTRAERVDIPRITFLNICMWFGANVMVAGGGGAGAGARTCLEAWGVAEAGDHRS